MDDKSSGPNLCKATVATFAPRECCCLTQLSLSDMDMPGLLTARSMRVHAVIQCASLKSTTVTVCNWKDVLTYTDPAIRQEKQSFCHATFHAKEESRTALLELDFLILCSGMQPQTLSQTATK
jgi:hypothetical protein